MCKFICIALVAGYLSIGVIDAQCPGGCCSSANATALLQESGKPGRKQWIMGINLLTLNYHPLTDEELLLYSAPGAYVYSVSRQCSVTGTLSYGITDRMVVTAMLPYNYSIDNKEGHYHVEEQSAELHSYGQIQGLGDGMLSITCHFVDDTEKGWKAYAGAGLKMPTGTTDAYSTYAVVLPVHLQPGTGSWDPLLSGGVEKSFGRLALRSEARVKFATNAAARYMGNYAHIRVFAGYDIPVMNNKSWLPLLNCSGGLAMDWNAPIRIAVESDHTHGIDSADVKNGMVTDPNSGFTRLLAGATLNTYITRFIFMPVTFTFPLMQQLQGHQSSLKFTASVGLS